ncbi:hypothetical protein EG328_001902 [Venturia inaequalis]|uniref:Uncharacterized protein n=1 Tax=Venturia inaequalis TaxID=5025 RepID=A0A8H3Z6W8_VENIN|nr:hypothetical protein EG328_001902 [Venturia inaequalis]
MLGRLRMNVPDCLAYYKVVGNSLFAHGRNVLPLGTKYKHKPLEKAVKEIVKKHCPVHVDSSCNGEDWLLWHLNEHGEEPGCLEPYTEDSVERIRQSICLTATHGTAVNEAYLLRSHNHEYGDLYRNERRPALLLSMGKGVPNKESDVVKYTQGEQSHQTMVLEAKGQYTWYKRLTVDKGLENMK